MNSVKKYAYNAQETYNGFVPDAFIPET